MRFRRKMILSYAALAFVLSLLPGFVWCYFDIREQRMEKADNLNFLSRQFSIQFDSTYDIMNQVTDYVLSDMDMLDAIRGLSDVDNQYYDRMRVSREATLRNKLSNNYFLSNFYRVIFFNPNGNLVYCTMNNDESFIDIVMEIEDNQLLEKADLLYGKPLLTGVHRDNWKKNEKEDIFSVIRAIQGEKMGYIEVQQRASVLEEMFFLPDDSTSVIALLPDNTVLYSNADKETETLKKLAEGKSDGNYQFDNCLMSVSTTRAGVRMILSENMKIGGRGERNTLFFAFLLIVCVYGLFMLFIVLISNRLTRPLHEIRALMEQTQTTDLNQEIHIDAADDELMSLGRAYENLLKRLGEAADTEKKLSILQLQAQFDALQAQVNPHFLYNVLNVISNRGMEDGDEGICEICGNLAGMLRYSTGNVERYATVRDELDYMERYVNLLQFRYEDKLNVVITCEKSIEKEILPKIVLQQLIENSVLHGYNKEYLVMDIHVKGFRDKTGWYIRVEDNGEGIGEEILQDLLCRIKEIREKIHVRQSAIEMEIGGMGLVNLYARLYLLYADKLVFEMENTRERGAAVTIGVRTEEKFMPLKRRNEEEDVQRTGSGRRACGTQAY